MRSNLLTVVAGLAVWAFLAVTPVVASDGLLMVRPENLGGAVEKMVTLEELRALPQVTIRTENEFSDGMNDYTGPLARDVMQIIGRGTGTKVKLTAANDYAVEIDLQEFDDFDAIFALDMNGVAFSVRDKGPIWVMYPLSDNAELQDPVYNNRLIWQLVRLEVE